MWICERCVKCTGGTPQFIRNSQKCILLMDPFNFQHGGGGGGSYIKPNHFALK